MSRFVFTVGAAVLVGALARAGLWWHVAMAVAVLAMYRRIAYPSPAERDRDMWRFFAGQHPALLNHKPDVPPRD